MSIILGSIFYNLSGDTNSFFGRGVLLFFTVLLNTFLGAFEVSLSPFGIQNTNTFLSLSLFGLKSPSSRNIFSMHFIIRSQKP